MDLTTSLQLRKHTLDGGDHYPPQNTTGSTNRELIDETVALSATDGGYIVTLGEYQAGDFKIDPPNLKAVAISGMLVESGLALE